ncbi:MAG: hypothetical protein NTY26_18230 [Burkholderiales bacterium]|nr:hypothetical protein [Burkholderiales bacterium]
MRSLLRNMVLGALALMVLAMPAFSGPMGFKDSWMAMGDFSPNWQEVFANYALTPRDALGASTLYMRSDDLSKSRQLVDATYTRLVKRWNQPQAQANVWFLGGLGNVSGNDFSGFKAMASPGIQVDYETTRVYASAGARLYRADGLSHDYASARLGFSFYAVDYDETQPWLVVEARRMNGLSDKTEITPMLRLVHNRYFAELGVNNSAQGRITLMYIF